MTRRIRYANQLAISLFDLQDQKELMIELAQLASAVLGTTTEINGFACTPDTPADLSVNVAGGAIFINENVDNTPFGTLPTQIPADTTNQIVKMAYTFTPTVFSFTPPATSGFSRNDLIQIGFQEQDGAPTSVPFYNGAGLPPIFQTVNVLRIDSVIIQVKPGIAAATGTQVTPTPDGGYAGAWVITTTNGQTQITSGDINIYPGAPFITEKLKDKISQATADARYVTNQALQYSGPIYCVDTGTTNNIVSTLTPAITNYNAGLNILCKILNTSTGAAAANFNGIGSINIVDQFGNPTLDGDLQAGMIAHFISDGTQLQLQNRATGVNKAIAGSAYINVAQTVTSDAVKLNFDTVEYDTNGLWDATNKRWVIQKTGYYEINTSCYVSSASGSVPNIVLYVNGVFSRIISQVTGTSNLLALNGSQTIFCNPGDYIEIWGGYGGAGTPLFGNNGGFSANYQTSSFQITFIGS